jgi:hypothetical protein
VTATVEIAAAGLTGTLEILTRRPGLQRATTALPGVGVMESGVNDGVVWENNPLTGPRIVDGTQAALALANASPDAPLHWAEAFSSVETTGIEDVNGEAAYRVVQTPSDGNPIASFFGVDSGLLVKHEFALATPVGTMPIEQFIEGYSDAGGILTARRVVVRQAGQQSVINITSVEANAEIPDERFDLPEAVQALLE